MVPQPSYFAHVGMDDYFLEESQAELSSVDQNPQTSHDVANPYLVAKNAFLTQQTRNHPVHAYASEKEGEQVQLIKQQASDPSSYTAQEVNNHSLPQA